MTRPVYLAAALAAAFDADDVEVAVEVVEASFVEDGVVAILDKLEIIKRVVAYTTVTLNSLNHFDYK